MRQKNGRGAATLFCVLSIGGILTLFAQSGLEHGDARALDLSRPEREALEKLLPAAVDGAMRTGAEMRKGSEDGEPPARLSLR